MPTYSSPNAGPPDCRFGLYGNAMGLPDCPNPVTLAGMYIYEPANSAPQGYQPNPEDVAAQQAQDALKIYSSLVKLIPGVGEVASTAVDLFAEAIGGKTKEESNHDEQMYALGEIKDKLDQLPSKIKEVLQENDLDGLRAKMSAMHNILTETQESDALKDPTGDNHDSVFQEKLQALKEQCFTAQSDSLRVRCLGLIKAWTWDNKTVLDILPGIHLMVVQCFLLAIALRTKSLRKAQEKVGKNCHYDAEYAVEQHTRDIKDLTAELRSFQKEHAREIDERIVTIVNDRRGKLSKGIEFYNEPNGKYPADGSNVGHQYIWYWYDRHTCIRWGVCTDEYSLNGCDLSRVDGYVRESVNMWHDWFVRNFEPAQKEKTKSLVKLSNRLKGIGEEGGQ